MLRPFGYLAFVVALGALSSAAWLLGERHELGYFSGRLARMMWAYPELTRRGIQTAWAVWLAGFLVAVSPIDPLSSPLDEIVLAALALIAVWHRLADGRRALR